jgi:hypothetical protein
MPGWMIRDRCPPNVNTRSVEGSMLPRLLPGLATCTESIATGLEPNSLLSRRRNARPPRLNRTTCRTVCMRTVGPVGWAGGAPQTPTHPVSADATSAADSAPGWKRIITAAPIKVARRTARERRFTVTRGRSRFGRKWKSASQRSQWQSSRLYVRGRLSQR